MSDTSLELQTRKIDEYRKRTVPLDNELAGVKLTVLPNVFPGGADSEVLCENVALQKGNRVLDLCTGNGIVALYLAQHGAKQVVGTDLNPAAIVNAKLNARQLNLANTQFIEADVFPSTGGLYDIITINLPYTDHPAPDKTAMCFWDEGNEVVKRFFRDFRKHLAPGGKAYVAWSDFADQALLPRLAKEHNCRLALVATKYGRSGFCYYAYRIDFM